MLLSPSGTLHAESQEKVPCNGNYTKFYLGKCLRNSATKRHGVTKGGLGVSFVSFSFFFFFFFVFIPS